MGCTKTICENLGMVRALEAECVQLRGFLRRDDEELKAELTKALSDLAMAGDVVKLYMRGGVGVSVLAQALSTDSSRWLEDQKREVWKEAKERAALANKLNPSSVMRNLQAEFEAKARPERAGGEQ